MEFSKANLFFAVTFATFIAINSNFTKRSTAERVCFVSLGCFSMGEPWHSLRRPLPAPMHPQDIDTCFHFYSYENPGKRYVVTLHPTVDLNGAPLDRSLPTAFLTHGFASNGSEPWLENLKDAYLSRVKGNVMVVDWGKGSKLLNYLQVASNTRIVGAELARAVKALDIHPKKLHFIGHSLGAHISGYAAKLTDGTARITALDPAQPAFEGFDQEVRLSSNDADFVDVVHTDARPFIPTFGFGMMYPVGDIDFYLNGGFDQPGCIVPDLSIIKKINSLADLARVPVEIISDLVGCPHNRAHEYFTESIMNDNCIFWGYETSIVSVAKSVANSLSQGIVTKFTALSPTCTENDCAPLGLFTRASHLRGSFVVTTKSRSPYCISEKDGPISLSKLIKSSKNSVSTLLPLPDISMPRILPGILNFRGRDQKILRKLVSIKPRE